MSDPNSPDASGPRPTPRKPKAALRPAQPQRPAVESLEDRLSPAVLLVNSLSDSSADTTHLKLRDAVQAVDSGSTGGLTAAQQAQISGTLGSNDTIQFDYSLVSAASQTIHLTTVGDSSDFGASALALTKNVTVVGPSGNHGMTITQDGTISGSNAMRLFYVAPGVTATIQNLTLSGGIAAGGKGGDGSNGAGGGGGGGLGAGGAIFNRGTLNLVGDTLSSNKAQGGAGGQGATGTGEGIGGAGGTGLGNGTAFGGGSAFGAGGLGADESAFDSFPGGFGGGGGGGGHEQAELPGRSGGFGAGQGGNALSHFVVTSTYTSSGITFTSGRTSVGAGGGGGGAGLGGGVFNAGGSLTLINSTLAQNTAQGGTGGLGAPAGPITGQSGTSGQGLGGAIFNLNGTVSVQNSTLASNSTAQPGNSGGGDTGGAVYNLAYADPSLNATVTLINSILANSTQGAASTKDLVNNKGPSGGGDTINAVKPNIVTSASNLGGTYNSGGVSSANPGLGALTNNGGPTATMLPGANAINKGDNASVTSATDQRGLSRIVGSQVDLGAVEAQNAVNVTGQMATEKGGFTKRPGTNLYAQTLTFTNNGGSLTGPFQVVLNGLPAGDTLQTASYVDPSTGKQTTLTISYTDGGAPVINVPQSVLAALGHGGKLKLALVFAVTNTVTPIGYTPTVYDDQSV